MWKREPSHTVGGNVIWCRHYGSTEVSQNIKNRISCNSTSIYLPKEYKNTSVKRYMLPYVHRSVIHNNQDTDATCVNSSVQFTRSVVSDSLWPHEPQYARPPCPSPSPRVHPNPCPLSRWGHNRWMDKSLYTYIHKVYTYLYTMEYNSVIKKWNRAISTTWVDLEGTTVSEIRQKEKEKYCMISCMHGNYKENKAQWKQTLS